MSPPKPSASFIWFDPQYRAGNPELLSAIKSFQRYLESKEREVGKRSRSRTDTARKSFGLAIHAIACNLVAAWLARGDRSIAIPLDHNAMWGKRRYNNPVFGQHFLDAIALLAALQFIEREATGFRLTRRKSAPSLFKPAGARLADHLPRAGARWDWIRREPDLEPIILKSHKDKDGNAVTIDYRDGKTIKAWRGQVARINRWLAAADLTVLDDEAGDTIDEDGLPIAPLRRSLRRTFNNATWQAGGRLSGGFWMSMPRAERFRRIRIGGERIADVDYQQLYPRLAYVIAQAEPPTGDIYDVLGDGSCRDGWKVLINALLFADGSLGNWPDGTRGSLPEGLKLREAVRLIEVKHAPIARLFGSGLGYRLMRLESDILISVITNLFKTGVPALPLHDAVLVRRSDVEAAKAAMEHELELRTGSGRGSVKIDFGPN